MKFDLIRNCDSREEHNQLKKDCARVASELNVVMSGFLWELKDPSQTTPRYSVRCVVNESLRKIAKELHALSILKLKSKKISHELYQLIVTSLDTDQLHAHYQKKNEEKVQPLIELSTKMIEMEMRLSRQEELATRQHDAEETLQSQIDQLRKKQEQSENTQENLEELIAQLEKNIQTKLDTLEEKIDTQQKLDRQFLNAVVRGEYDNVIELLNAGANPNANNSLALRLAVQNNQLPIATLLVASGVSCDALDVQKTSARQLAENSNKTEFTHLFNRQRLSFLEEVEQRLSEHKKTASEEQRILLSRLKLLDSKLGIIESNLKIQAEMLNVLDDDALRIHKKIKALENQMQLGQLDRSAIKSELEPLRIEYHIKQQKIAFHKALLEKSNPSLSVFYNTLIRKVGELFLACYALQSGLISADDGIMGSLESAGEMLPIVGTFVALGVKAAAYIRGKQEEKKTTRAVDLIRTIGDIDNITEDLASALSSRYRLQIELMTEKGAEDFAQCCMSRLYYFLRSKESYIDERTSIIGQFIEGMLEQKPIKITKKKGIRATKPIETKEPSLHSNWNEAGVMQKAGLMLINTIGNPEFYSCPEESEDIKREKLEQKRKKKEEKADYKALTKAERKEQKKSEKLRKQVEGPELNKRAQKQKERFYGRASKYGYAIPSTNSEIQSPGLKQDSGPKGPLVFAQKELDELMSTKAAKKHGIDTATVNQLKQKAKVELAKFYSRSSSLLIWQSGASVNSSTAPSGSVVNSGP